MNRERLMEIDRMIVDSLVVALPDDHSVKAQLLRLLAEAARELVADVRSKQSWINDFTVRERIRELEEERNLYGLDESQTAELGHLRALLVASKRGGGA